MFKTIQVSQVHTFGPKFFYYTSITSEHVQTSVPLLSTVICPEKAHFIHNLTLLLPTLTKKKKTKKISIFEKQN